MTFDYIKPERPDPNNPGMYVGGIFIPRSMYMPDKRQKIRGNDPKLTERPLGKGERIVEVDGENWTFKVGSSHVVVRKPNGHGIQIAKYRDNGEPNLDIGEMAPNAERDGESLSVTPFTVATFIRNYKRRNEQ